MLINAAITGSVETVILIITTMTGGTRSPITAAHGRGHKDQECAGADHLTAEPQRWGLGTRRAPVCVHCQALPALHLHSVSRARRRGRLLDRDSPLQVDSARPRAMVTQTSWPLLLSPPGVCTEGTDGSLSTCRKRSHRVRGLPLPRHRAQPAPPLLNLGKKGKWARL